MKLVTGSAQQAQAIAATDPLADLVAGAVAGDRVTLARLLGAVGPAVLGVVRSVLGPDHPDVADVAQEALLAIRGALRSFRGESSVTHYARRIALRIALSAQRRSLRRRKLDQAAAPPDPIATATDADDDPALRARRIAAFRGLMQELPAAQAESLAMRVALDYSLPQIAAETGAPVNTVRSRVRLALETLRRRIGRDPALREILGGQP
jgi:RNA polymerase sigma factor (sigma-70 family)